MQTIFKDIDRDKQTQYVITVVFIFKWIQKIQVNCKLTISILGKRDPERDAASLHEMLV